MFLISERETTIPNGAPGNSGSFLLYTVKNQAFKPNLDHGLHFLGTEIQIHI